jgi:hypothetical protein
VANAASLEYSMPILRECPVTQVTGRCALVLLPGFGASGEGYQMVGVARLICDGLVGWL